MIFSTGPAMKSTGRLEVSAPVPQQGRAMIFLVMRGLNLVEIADLQVIRSLVVAEIEFTFIENEKEG
jgi:hypothetical protein